MEALLNLYANTDIIAEAVDAERKIRASQYERHQEELNAVDQEISNAEAAANRYMRAFEQGELDAKTCASRTNAIQVKLGLLRNRREDPKHLLEQMPGKPSAKAVA